MRLELPYVLWSLISLIGAQRVWGPSCGSAFIWRRCDLPFIPHQSRKLELSSVELASLLEQKGCLPIDKQLLSIPSEHLAY
jgi:hypothetical protein